MIEKDTKVIAANNTNSLRTTIPSQICKLGNLKVGDQMRWIVDETSGTVMLKFLKTVAVEEIRLGQT